MYIYIYVFVSIQRTHAFTQSPNIHINESRFNKLSPMNTTAEHHILKITTCFTL
jgi:hypothetical protein